MFVWGEQECVQRGGGATDWLYNGRVRRSGLDTTRGGLFPPLRPGAAVKLRAVLFSAHLYTLSAVVCKM